MGANVDQSGSEVGPLPSCGFDSEPLPLCTEMRRDLWDGGGPRMLLWLVMAPSSGKAALAEVLGSQGSLGQLVQEPGHSSPSGASSRGRCAGLHLLPSMIQG